MFMIPFWVLSIIEHLTQKGAMILATTHIIGVASPTISQMYRPQVELPSLQKDDEYSANQVLGALDLQVLRPFGDASICRGFFEAMIGTLLRGVGSL